MKRVFLGLFIAIGLTLFTLYRTDGFFLSKIQGPLVQGTALAPDFECQDYLHQPFYYFAKGRQCYVFISADGQTVIKFLNYSRFSLPRWLCKTPLPHYWKMWLVGLEDKRRLRFEATMNSFQLAMEQLRDETGLIYLHIQQGGNLPAIEIVDQAHRAHHVDLNNTTFLLQKKATPIYEALDNLYRTGGERSLNQGIHFFISFLQKRCSLLLADDDRDVEINFGFDRGHLILLDPGRLFYDPSLENPDRVEREIRIASKRLHQWLSQNYPESALFLENEVEQAIKNLTEDRTAYSRF